MLYLIITILIIAADQIIKYFIASGMDTSSTAFSVLGIFDVTYVQNRGAAFSVLSGKTVFLGIVSVLFCVVLILFWLRKKPTNRLMCTALTLLLAGAAGNGIDRIFRGFVVDYINLSFMSFPVFNLADIAVTVGAGLFVLYIILFDREDKNGNDNT